jgi:restriction system protein
MNAGDGRPENQKQPKETCMAVPGYQDLMLPLLKLAADGNEHKTSDAMEALAQQLGVTEQEQELMLPSGSQTRYYNRLTWAVTYLTKSLLLDKTGRGKFKIAPRGLQVLQQNPPRINNALLEQFAEYKAFKTKKNKAKAAISDAHDGQAGEIDPDVTPDEQLDAAYKELQETLADELLGRVRKSTPKFFEHLVVDLLVAMGYGGTRMDAAQVVGKSGDGGIDGVIKEDRLGLDMVYVQAKRHEADIGPGAIREFVGSLGEHKAHKGVFITCGGFTAGAQEAAAKAHTRIVLIDGEKLAEYMIEHGVGVAHHKTYTVKKIDGDYFGDI